MPLFPLEPADAFEAAGTILGFNPQNAAFQANEIPSSSGFQVRQSKIPNNRPARSVRKLIHWLIPEGPIVQMYINPQNISYSYKKTISDQRTKGGYTLQYWGPALPTLSISGTTGTSGIEGINVLYDIYQSEQLSFDPYALFLASKKQREEVDLFALGTGGTNNSTTDDIGQFLLNSAQNQISPKQAPTLASLAFSVEMYWSGEVYRGYFTDFNVKESATNLGIFDYDMNFTVTQKRGYRNNFLAWHRSAVDGPSNSDPKFGTPYSFGSLVGGNARPPRLESTNFFNEFPSASFSPVEAFNQISNAAEAVGNSVSSIFNQLF